MPGKSSPTPRPWLPRCRCASFALSSGGTDNHLILMDMTNRGITGYAMAKALDASGIVCNFNRVPFDPRPARKPSGIRIGTPAITSRGFGTEEMRQLAEWVDRVAQVRANKALELDDRKTFYAEVAAEVRALCARFSSTRLTLRWRRKAALKYGYISRIRHRSHYQRRGTGDAIERVNHAPGGSRGHAAGFGTLRGL